VKDVLNKLPLALVPPALMPAVALVMEYGTRKYGLNDWRDGGDYTDYISAALRHIFAFNEGRDLDEESGIHHLAHAAANLGMLLQWIGENRGNDDRYITQTQVSRGRPDLD
jgi:hypothetical protein